MLKIRSLGCCQNPILTQCIFFFFVLFFFFTDEVSVVNKSVLRKKDSCDSITPCNSPSLAVTARLGMIGAQVFLLTRFVSKVTKVLEPFSSIPRNVYGHKKENSRVNSFYQQRHHDSTKFLVG